MLSSINNSAKYHYIESYIINIEERRRFCGIPLYVYVAPQDQSIYDDVLGE